MQVLNTSTKKPMSGQHIILPTDSTTGRHLRWNNSKKSFQTVTRVQVTCSRRYKNTNNSYLNLGNWRFIVSIGYLIFYMHFQQHVKYRQILHDMLKIKHSSDRSGKTKSISDKILVNFKGRQLSTDFAMCSF